MAKETDIKAAPGTVSAPAKRRVKIFSERHTDGDLTVLRGSVIEVDEGTADYMVNTAQCAEYTTEDVKHILPQ